MSAIKNLFNASKLALVAGAALTITTKTAKAQLFGDANHENDYNYALYVGLGTQASRDFNSRGEYAYFGGEVPLAGKWLKAWGEYEVFFRDRNAQSSASTYSGRDALTGIPTEEFDGETFIPSRLKAMIGVGLPSGSPLQLNAMAGVGNYFGDSQVNFDDADFVTRVEGKYEFARNKHSVVGLSLGAYVEYEKYNNNFYNYYHPRGTNTASVGIRLAANLFPGAGH